MGTYFFSRIGSTTRDRDRASGRVREGGGRKRVAVNDAVARRVSCGSERARSIDARRRARRGVRRARRRRVGDDETG
jgi:hypothetical protein